MRVSGPTEFPPLSCRGSRCSFEGSSWSLSKAKGRGRWVWEKLEAGRLAKKQLQRGRCKEERLGKGQGRADSKKQGLSSPRDLGEREEGERSRGFARG